MHLCCADLTLLEDSFLERKSGGTVMIPVLDEDMDPEHLENRSQWCGELSDYFVTKGKDWLAPFPVYGKPFHPKCPLCSRIIDGTDRHLDEHSEIEELEDEFDVEAGVSGDQDGGLGDQEEGSGHGDESESSGEGEFIEASVVLGAKLSDR
jgi:hypothetical protein